MVCVYQVLMARIVYLTPLGVASLLALLMVQKDLQPLLSIFGLVFLLSLPTGKHLFLSVNHSALFAVLEGKLLLYLFLLLKSFIGFPVRRKKIAK
jgi:hypothetical protein